MYSMLHFAIEYMLKCGNNSCISDSKVAIVIVMYK